MFANTSGGKKRIYSSIVFPQECPSGVVNEETFKHIYAQFFPHGGTASLLPLLQK